MAWYEITASPINDAAEKIKLFANDLNTLSERLDSIFIELPQSTHLTQQKRQISGNLRNISTQSASLGQALDGVIEVYTNAERSAFGNTERTKAVGAVQPTISQPSILRQSNSVLMFGDLVTPDWLQTAVLKYEQSKHIGNGV